MITTSGVKVVSVTYNENGLRTLAVNCECGDTHEVAWPKDTIELCGELPCGSVLSGVEIPAWCFDPRHRTGFRKYPQRPHSVVGDSSPPSELAESTEGTQSGADGLNDNASGEYEHNWTE